VAHTYSFQGQSLLPRQGVFCAVVAGGTVAAGDPVTLLATRESD
jgi:MOSC domain-containing protein YiiM